MSALTPKPQICLDDIGRCAYCKTLATPERPQSKLTAEHIIPESLGGRYYLGHASCLDCNKLTHSFEGYCAGTIFYDARPGIGWPRKRKRKNKTWRDVTIHIAEDEKSIPRRMPLNQLPPVLLSFRFPPSTFSQGLPPSDRCNVDVRPIPIHDWDKKRRSFPRYVHTIPFKLKPYCQLLYKIAHCYTCHWFGLDGFEPYLVPIIRGERDDLIFHFISGSDLMIPNLKRDLHVVSLSNNSDQSLIRVVIQLFAPFNAPAVEIVAGRRFAEPK